MAARRPAAQQFDVQLRDNEMAKRTYSGVSPNCGPFLQYFKGKKKETKHLRGLPTHLGPYIRTPRDDRICHAFEVKCFDADCGLELGLIRVKN